MKQNITEEINISSLHAMIFLKNEFDLEADFSGKFMTSVDIKRHLYRHLDISIHQIKKYLITLINKYPKAISRGFYYKETSEGVRKIPYILYDVNGLAEIGIMCHSYYHDNDIHHRYISDSLHCELLDCLDNLDANFYEVRLLKRFLYFEKFLYTYDDKDRHFTIAKGSDGVITYMPKGKKTIITDNGNWAKKNRQEIKTGKGIRRIFKDLDINPTIIEKLSNAIKSKHTFTGEIKIVKGDDIAKYYHWTKHAQGRHASLSNSCMRHDDCEDYFQIYTRNPDKVSLIIAVDKDDKVFGRALLWNVIDNSNGEEALFMDRAYGNDLTVERLKKYGKELGAYIKYKQTYNDSRVVSTIGEVIDARFTVELENCDNRKYPYMDTLYNADNIYEDVITISTYIGSYSLTSTEGYIDDDDRRDTVETVDGYEIDEDEAVWSEWEDGYIESDHAVYSEYSETYIREGNAVYLEGSYYHEDDDCICIEITGGHELKDNCIFSDYENEFIHEDNTTECAIHGYIRNVDGVAMTIDDLTYTVHRNVTIEELKLHLGHED